MLETMRGNWELFWPIICSLSLMLGGMMGLAISQWLAALAATQADLQKEAVRTGFAVWEIRNNRIVGVKEKKGSINV